MQTPPASGPTLSQIAWLGDVREVRHPLSRLRPIWVRGGSPQWSGPPPPAPTVAHPERHPYCEFGITFKGNGIEYIGREQANTSPGTVMLLGPGVPHYAELLDYPRHGVTIYFLPILLFDLGPLGDGARILSRFTAEQSIRERVVYPPPTLVRRLKRDSTTMFREFERGEFGSELRLRALLVDMLVALLRWEEAAGIRLVSQADPMNWDQIQRALQYLHEHHAEPIYVQQVALAAGISESRLKAAFRESLGISCVQYLKAYRVSLAAAKLSSSTQSVTEVAYAVGFETLSHFNTAFRDLIGMSPTEYLLSERNKST